MHRDEKYLQLMPGIGSEDCSTSSSKLVQLEEFTRLFIMPRGRRCGGSRRSRRRWSSGSIDADLEDEL